MKILNNIILSKVPCRCRNRIYNNLITDLLIISICKKFYLFQIGDKTFCFSDIELNFAYFQVGSEGVVNPAFVTSMDSINIEGHTWSDTSSDNVKDPLSSKASTLTREVQEIHDGANSRSSTLTRDDKGSDGKTSDESNNINNNNGIYYEPLNDLREQKR